MVYSSNSGEVLAPQVTPTTTPATPILSRKTRETCLKIISAVCFLLGIASFVLFIKEAAFREVSKQPVGSMSKTAIMISAAIASGVFIGLGLIASCEAHNKMDDLRKIVYDYCLNW